jgi:phenylalanyl-tRNA synthetase alpha chain
VTLKTISQLQTKALKEINLLTDKKSLEKLRITYLGRQAFLNQTLKKINNLPADQRGKVGQAINTAKQKISQALVEKQPTVSSDKSSTSQTTPSEVTLTKQGHLHPLTQTENEINRLFVSIGFSMYEGPEIETDEYCFQRLNVPKDHPARDMQDSLYLKEPDILLSTQTSSIEARLLEKEKPPFKAAFPGHAFRNEKVNKSNHFIFHQYQGVAVDKNITMKDLIGVFDLLFKHLYGQQAIVRYRCKYYPEVEPGLGLDLQCFSCHGKGCPLCKNAGWIEMGGAGIIHPTVLQKAGIEPKKWRGFAFGLGLDRWAMAKYNIKDIRTLTGGNLAYIPYLK